MALKLITTFQFDLYSPECNKKTIFKCEMDDMVIAKNVGVYNMT